MPKNKAQILKLLLLISLTIIGCRRDPIPDEPAGTCDGYASDIKDWVLFQPGTYWIYEEENSGTLDSVYVTFATDYGDTSLAEFLCETYNTRDDYHYDYYRNNIAFPNNCYPKLCNNNWCLMAMRSKSKPGDVIGQTRAFLFYPHIGNFAYGPSPTYNYTTVHAIHDEMVVGSDTFSNVVQIHEAVNITEHNQETIFSFVKNFGIIKKELLDSNQVWNLIRYKIVQ